MSNLKRLFLLTTIATFVLISVGGFVRVAGAGLGCPDWPQCYGRWYPPTDVAQVPAEVRAQFNVTKAWIEYTNRLVGVLIGLFSLATCVQAFRVARDRPDVLWPAVGAVLLIGFQGWQGGQVVGKELDPEYVSAHLLTALLIAAVLLYGTLRAWTASPSAPMPGAMTTGDRPIRRLAWVARASLVVLVAQIGLGAFVRGEVELTARRTGLPRSDWLATVGRLDLTHRQLGVVCLALFAWLALECRRRLGSGTASSRLATLAIALAGMQIAAGLALAYLGLPAWAQLVHLTVSAWLFGATWVLALVLRPGR